MVGKKENWKESVNGSFQRNMANFQTWFLVLLTSMSNWFLSTCNTVKSRWLFKPTGHLFKVASSVYTIVPKVHYSIDCRSTNSFNCHIQWTSELGCAIAGMAWLQQNGALQIRLLGHFGALQLFLVQELNFTLLMFSTINDTKMQL